MFLNTSTKSEMLPDMDADESPLRRPVSERLKSAFNIIALCLSVTAHFSIKDK